VRWAARFLDQARKAVVLGRRRSVPGKHAVKFFSPRPRQCRGNTRQQLFKVENHQKDPDQGKRIRSRKGDRNLFMGTRVFCNQVPCAHDAASLGVICFYELVRVAASARHMG